MKTIKPLVFALFCFILMVDTHQVKAQNPSLYLTSGSVTNPIIVGQDYEECVYIYNGGASGDFDFELDFDNTSEGYITVVEKICGEYIASGSTVEVCFNSNAVMSSSPGTYETNLIASYSGSTCSICGTSPSCYDEAISDGFNNPQTVTVSASCTDWYTSPTSGSFTAAGGSGSFTIYSSGGCGASVQSSASWINGITAAGGGVIDYDVSANTTCSSQTGYIYVYNDNSVLEATYTITEAGLTAPSTPGSISGATSVCSGIQGSYSIGSVTGATSYTWTLPSGWTGSSATNSITATVGSSGGTISVKATNTCGTSSAQTLNVTVNTVPTNANASANPSTVCQASTLNLSSSATGATSYNWSGPNGYSSAQQDPSVSNIQSSEAGTYKVTASNTCGSATASVNVTVNPLPTNVTASATPSPICQGVTLNLSSNASGANSYSWSGPDGFNSAQQNPSISNIQSNQAGTYTVAATNSCGNTSATVSVSVNPLPTNVSASAFPNPACQSGILNLTSSATNGTTYSWNGPNGYSSAQQNPSISNVQFSEAGTYTITAGNSCGSATASVAVTVNNAPVNPTASANPSTVCQASTLNLSSSATGATSYNWSGPNGYSSVQQNPSISNIQPNQAGTYTITTSNTCGSITASVSVTVNPLPTNVNASASPNPVCQGAVLNLTSSATNAVSYIWNGPDGFSSAQQNPTVTNMQLVQAGTYTLTADNNCGSATAAVSVTVNPIPTNVTASADPNPVCLGSNLNLTSSATNATLYSWSGPNGFSSAQQNPSVSDIQSSDAGSYVITSSNSCGSASASVNVSVSQPNHVSVTISIVDTNVCITDQAIVTASPTNGGGNPSYTWFVNNVQVVGSSSTLNYTFPSTGYYTVYCNIGSSLTCFTPASAQSNTLIINVTGQATPAVTISASSPTICAGTADTITAIPSTGGNNPTYQWSLNGTSVLGNSTATFVSSSFHNNDAVSCTMTSSSSCATTPTATSNTVSINVDSLVTPLVSILANPSGAICTGTPVIYSATSTNGGTNPVFEWRINGNYQLTNANSFTDHSVNNNDVVTCVLISNATCATPDSVTSNSVTETVDTAVTPSVNIVSNAGNSFCTGTCVTFTATPLHGGYTPIYQWYQNASQVGADSASFSTCALNNSDVINCVLTSNAACATTNTATSNSIAITITSSISPTITITANPGGTVCPGTVINFTVTETSGGGTSPVYQWQVRPSIGNVGNGSTTFSDSTLTSSDVVVCLLTSSLSCASPQIAISNGITPSFYPSPTGPITPTGPVSFCPGDSVQLCGPGVNPEYVWSTGASAQCIYVKYAGLYSVTATNVNNCSAAASVIVGSYPSASIPNIMQVSDSLYTTTSASDYQWYLNNQPVSGATNAGYVASQNGSYYVVATDSNGCPGKSTVIHITSVGINELTSVSNFTITPNPSNGRFMITFETGTSEDIVIKVFDPVGRIIKTEQNVKVAGTYSRAIDLSAAAAGMYIIQLVSGDKTLNRKLEISK